MTDTESEEARQISEDTRKVWSRLHFSPDACHHQQRSRRKTFQLDNMISDLDASIKQLEEFLNDEANQEQITNVAKMIPYLDDRSLGTILLLYSAQTCPISQYRLCTLVERGVVGIRRRCACKYPFQRPCSVGEVRDLILRSKVCNTERQGCHNIECQPCLGCYGAGR